MLKLYNTLTHSIEEFKPLTPKKVGMYSCGPTVYDFQHIGHMRRYVGDDLLIRTLTYNGYTVKHVMNITDVGHLVSDSDTGEDKMEKGAKKFGMSVWEIAKKFEQQFWDSIDLLNIERPTVVIHATDAIAEQIALIKTLEEKGYTYTITDGVYFDTAKFKNYFKLSGQKPEELKAGARVEVVEGKRSPQDFALWKFTPSEARRQMEWDSPWGKGFPGWHIECSAMSMKELGETLDIHTGGIDHISIHHTNEIAQSEAATDKQFVNYWVHHNFLTVEGQKMSKSLGNIYTVEDVKAKGFDSIALRYLYLQTHYRQEMNFTWEALEASQKAYKRLLNEVASWDQTSTSIDAYTEKFITAINDDLNFPKALAILWELVKSDHPTGQKAATLFTFDEVLGLQLREIQDSGFNPSTSLRTGIQEEKIPEEVQGLIQERDALRQQKQFDKADEVREKINALGYTVQDTPAGKQLLTKK